MRDYISSLQSSILKTQPILMMRNILFFAVLFLSLTVVNAQKKTWPDAITVKGSVQFIEPKDENNIVRLYKVVMDGDYQIIDSAKLTESNKSFSFKVKQG